MNKNLKKRIRMALAFIAFIVFPISSNYFILNLPTAHAADYSLSGLSDQMTRNSISKVSDHDIRWRQVTQMGSAGHTIVIDFNTAGFTNGSADYTDIDFYYGSDQAQVNGSCASSCTNATLAATTGAANTWGAAFSSNNLTLTWPASGGTTVNANDYVRIMIGLNASGGNAQMTNPGSIGSKTINITCNIGLNTNSGKIAIAMINTDYDLLSVSANVDPSLAFTMTPTTLLFGTLTTANIRYANDTTGATTIPAQANTPLLTASTNGVSGVLISIYDAGNGTGGLYSSTVSELIPASSVNGLVAGNKKFGVTGLSGSSLTLTPGFSGTSTNGTGTISNVAQSFASSAGPVASGSAAMIMVASIDALTKAGAYTDIVTVVCTGRF